MQRSKLKRNRFPSPPKFKRTIITDKKEIARLDEEDRNTELQIKLEKKEELAAPQWHDTEAAARKENEEGWAPPATLQEFYFLADRTFPHWSFAERGKWARRMLKRSPFINKAVVAGLKEGRDIRERKQRKMGVWWEELEELEPAEREFVVNFVVRKVTS